MANHQFNILLDYHIKDFINKYKTLSRKIYTGNASEKIIHTGEFGLYREEICEKFLRIITPSYFGAGTGFIITKDNEGDTSHQCDIVIYDTHATPIIQAAQFPRFFPIETTLAVGEIKSVIQTKKDLFIALKKLADIKRYRLNTNSPILKRDRILEGKPFNPRINAYDQVFTFLICEDFRFDIEDISDFIDEAYSGIEVGLRHNMILSIKKGLLLYVDANGKSLSYPIFNGMPLKNRFIKPDKNDSLVHFKFFCTYFFMGMSSATVLFPEMTDYIGDFSGYQNCDQK